LHIAGPVCALCAAVFLVVAGADRMSNVVRFPVSRIVRLVPAYQEQASIESARRWEHMLHAMEEGRLPARFAEDCLPGDVEAL
jgi:hypothetical protein